MNLEARGFSLEHGQFPIYDEIGGILVGRDLIKNKSESKTGENLLYLLVDKETNKVVATAFRGYLSPPVVSQEQIAHYKFKSAIPSTDKYVSVRSWDDKE